MGVCVCMLERFEYKIIYSNMYIDHRSFCCIIIYLFHSAGLCFLS